ncbi:MAG TPA: hypothetical protein VGM37_21075 [Armatimonadota bacterium]|jgi:hypothetical protein
MHDARGLVFAAQFMAFAALMDWAMRRFVAHAAMTRALRLSSGLACVTIGCGCLAYALWGLNWYVRLSVLFAAATYMAFLLMALAAWIRLPKRPEWRMTLKDFIAERKNAGK